MWQLSKPIIVLSRVLQTSCTCDCLKMLMRKHIQVKGNKQAMPSTYLYLHQHGGGTCSPRSQTPGQSNIRPYTFTQSVSVMIQVLFQVRGQRKSPISKHSEYRDALMMCQFLHSFLRYLWKLFSCPSPHARCFFSLIPLHTLLSPVGLFMLLGSCSALSSRFNCYLLRQFFSLSLTFPFKQVYSIVVLS